MSKTTSKSNDLFKWDKHSDAVLKYRFFERKLETTLNQGKTPRGYILDSDAVREKRGVLPVLIPVWSAAERVGKTPAEIADHERIVKENREEREKIRAQREAVNQDIIRGIADLESLFDLECEARTIIATAKDPKKNPRVNLRLIRAAIREKFEPSRAVDGIQIRQELLNLTDCGRTFSSWVAEHARLRGLLTALEMVVDDAEIEQAIVQHVWNPSFQSYKDQLVVATAGRVYGADSTYPWTKFIRDCEVKTATSVLVDNWGLTKREDRSGEGLRALAVKDTPDSSGRGSGRGGRGGGRGGRGFGGRGGRGQGGGRSPAGPAGVCWRCGRSGHNWFSCPSVSCSVCGKQIGKFEQGAQRDHNVKNCKPIPAEQRKFPSIKAMKSSALKARIVKMKRELDSREGSDDEIDRQIKLLRLVKKARRGSPPEDEYLSDGDMSA